VNKPVRTDLRGLFAALLVAVAGLSFATALPAHAASGHQVTMSGYAFHPAALTLTAGDTVTWTNQDTAPHDVEVTSGPVHVHSPMLSKGASWSFTFTTAGTYAYVCTVHPGMDAGLVVRPAPTKAPVLAPAPARTTAHAQHLPTAGVPTSRTAATHRASAPARTTSPTPTATGAAMPMPAGTPSTAAAAPVADQPAAADPARPLRPLLVLAALVLGVAVVCLLLVASRSAAARASDRTVP
jgi:amicyanin